MSSTSNEAGETSTSTPPREEMDYREVRLRLDRPLPKYFGTTINVAEERIRATIRRLNKMLREGRCDCHE